MTAPARNPWEEANRARNAAMDSAAHLHETAVCDADCTTGPEGVVLHSVEHQFRLAGGKIKTCPVCGEGRHPGTCIDATEVDPAKAKKRNARVAKKGGLR